MKATIGGVVLFLGVALATICPASGQSGTESWPQRFELYKGENVAFGFVVTQPGVITVSVASQGQPIVVRLSGPPAQPVQQTGGGSLRLSYNATPADVQKNRLWLGKNARAGFP